MATVHQAPITASFASGAAHARRWKTRPPESPRDPLQALGLNLADHPVWAHAFPEEVRLEQIRSDLFAGRSVSGLLIAIVTFGLVLGVGAVLLCL